MKIVTTTYDYGAPHTEVRDLHPFPDDDRVENRVINLYPDERYQTLLGFGGAFTEAAGYTFSLMGEGKRREILSGYFGPDGLGYTLCRLHLDSCDFCLGNYSAVTDETDAGLSTFSLSRDEQYIFPLLRWAQESGACDLQFLMSPWSPPAFMKTNGMKNCGGKLLPQYRQLWADYMARYVRAYRDRGVDVAMLSVQNEPNAAQPWDSCIYTPQEEMAFVRDHLGPAMEAYGLSDVKVLIWDHNKERAYERARAVFDDPVAERYARGVAVHWYSGDHFDALSLIARRYPHKLIIHSEGAFELIPGEGIDQLAQAQAYAHHYIGNLHAGAHGLIDWNLALQANGGPNHVNNLAVAPIMCDTVHDTYERQLSHTYIGHFSRYIRPGAVRIGTSVFTDRLEVTAFQNTDGSLAVVVLNRWKEDIPFRLRYLGRLIPKLAAHRESISTLLLD
ncbi:MAG: glucosylceramidase [Lachnospiraceae bacterium]|jgi:glucosylceramidase|nr:glucosylceramidase [Lachnospiraceae bacterium]